MNAALQTWELSPPQGYDWSMYDFKVGREDFQHDTSKVNGSHIAKSPYTLTFLLDVMDWKWNILRQWEDLP